MIQQITKDMILNGVGLPEEVPCCMFDINNRTYRCDMWSQIFDEIGCIGYSAREENKPAGQLIFLPKKYARKIGLSTCQTNERLGTTILVGCLMIFSECRNKGLASMMIQELIDFCKSAGYNRIEVGVCNKPAGNKWVEQISFFPFRKFGFVLDETARAHEFKPEELMCYLDL